MSRIDKKMYTRFFIYEEVRIDSKRNILNQYYSMEHVYFRVSDLTVL